MKYEIENPVKIEGKLLATVISNGNKERVTVSEKTLKQIKKKQPELHKLVVPFFEDVKKSSPVKSKSVKTKTNATITIDMLKDKIKDIPNVIISLEKDGKSYKIRANRNLYYLKDSKKYGFILGWNELKKSSMRIENEKQLNDIVEEIKSYASKVK